MKKLNEASLKIGDIILTTTTATVSKAIRAATRSDISHAMIYVQDHSVIDVTAEGVQARNTQRLFFEDDCSVYVLRLRDGLAGEQAKAICSFVRGQIGTQYSTKEAIRAAIGGARQWTKKQFCSRLVAQAYASVGINLVDDPNFCSPENLKAGPVLIEVQNATVPVTAEEAAHWEGREDLPQIMRTATNTILNRARTKNKDIQNFDDLDRYLVAHLEDDEFVCGLLETSGYLTVWKIEKETNPWQYDLDLMRAFAAAAAAAGAGVEEYCWSVLADEQTGPNRYFVNHGGYAQLSRLFGLRTFRVMMELYDVLASLHCTRVEVATKWLEENGLLTPVPERILRPHTPEWFAALEVWNPPQAAMTKMAIKTAGNPDVCSICGDDPARDYRLEEAYRPAGGVDTLRLCDDCLKIRKDRGEPYASLIE